MMMTMMTWRTSIIIGLPSKTNRSSYTLCRLRLTVLAIGKKKINLQNYLSCLRRRSSSCSIRLNLPLRFCYKKGCFGSPQEREEGLDYQEKANMIPSEG